MTAAGHELDRRFARIEARLASLEQHAAQDEAQIQRIEHRLVAVEDLVEQLLRRLPPEGRPR